MSFGRKSAPDSMDREMVFEAVFERETFSGSLFLEATASGIEVSLSAQDKLFKASVEIAEFGELDAEEQEFYFQKAAKKISFDEGQKVMACARILGIPAWSCAVKKVPLFEREHFKEELNEARERIGALEVEVNLLRRKVRRLETRREVEGIVKFQYTNGVLEYEHNVADYVKEKFEAGMLAYFKFGIIHCLNSYREEDVKRSVDRYAVNMGTFYSKLIQADTFEKIQDLVLTFRFIWRGNEPEKIPFSTGSKHMIDKKVFEERMLFVVLFQINVFWFCRPELLLGARSNDPSHLFLIREPLNETLVLRLRFADNYFPTQPDAFLEGDCHASFSSSASTIDNFGNAGSYDEENKIFTRAGNHTYVFYK
jgi:hypothetical protein